jgi:glycosyltransferase involved in cell wall biosynthesis
MGKALEAASRRIEINHMKIALYCSNEHALPLHKDIIYAPLPLFERLAMDLAEKGHTIFLYASTDSAVSHPNIRIMSHGLVSYVKAGYNNIWGTFSDQDVVTLYDQLLVAEMLADDKKYNFDVIHFYHMITRFLPLLKEVETPIIATLHDPVNDKREFVFRSCEWRNKVQYVSVSDSQRKGFPSLSYAKTIYNAVDTDLYSFNDSPEDYFVFLGRISNEKGTHLAIAAALQAGVKLKVIGPDWGTFDYWKKEVEPYLDDKNIEYIGSLPRKETIPYLANAKALLFPIQWEEPFGLVLIEALACGTPVIAFNKGSVPEIITDGTTGFIVGSTEEMAEATARIGAIRRQACRDAVEERFTFDTMANEYESLYQNAGGSPGERRR